MVERTNPSPEAHLSTLPVIGSKGLHPSENPLSAVPAGAMALADNCVTPFKDVLEPRRGQKHKAYGYGISGVSKAGCFFDESEIVQVGSTLLRDTGSAYSAYSGTFAEVDPAQQRLKFCQAAQSLYINSAAGVFVLDSLAGQPVLAGVPKALDINPVDSYLEGAPDAGWMPDDDGTGAHAGSQVAYWVCYGLIDANGHLKLGAPSGRFTITNPAKLVVAVGNMNRYLADTSSVKVENTPHGFKGSDQVTLSPGEALFASGVKTISPLNLASNSFQYTDAGNDGDVNTLEQTFTSGSKDTALSIPLRSGLTTSHFVRIYRSPVSAKASGEGSDPGDEGFEVYEAALTQQNIDEGLLLWTDRTPESALRAATPLYANPNTGSVENGANEQPPLCRDICEWDDRVWYINTTDKHRFHLTLIGCGTPDGLQGGDRIIIAGYSYLGVDPMPADGLLNEGEFQVFTGGTPGQNIRDTARSLVNAINGNTYGALIGGLAAPVVYAWDESSILVPGKILLEERAIGGEAFYCAASRATCWAPALPAPLAVVAGNCYRNGDSAGVATASAHGFTEGQSVALTSNSPNAAWPIGAKLVAGVPVPTAFYYLEAGGSGSPMTATYYVHAVTGSNTSKNDRRKNGLSYSKRGMPDAVPLTNWEPADCPANFEVLRCIPLQDKMLLFDDRGGIHTVAKGTPYAIDSLDGSAVLVSPDSAVRHNNQVHAFTTQGVCAITDAGVRILSPGLEEELLALLATAGTTVGRYAFGITYESDRQYILYLPESSTDTVCRFAYVWNSMQETWMRWTGNRTWGVVQPLARLLHLGDGDSSATRVERKTGTAADYSDESLPVTILAASGKSVHLASVAGVAVGDLLIQSEAVKSLVDSVDTAVDVVTVRSTEGFAPGPAEVEIAYECAGKSTHLAPGGPAIEKNFRALHLHFRRMYAADFRAVVDSEKCEAESEESIQELGFGMQPFGAAPFGSPVTLRNRRVGVASAHARSTHIRVGFRIREARALWSLHGYSLDHEMVGEVSSR